MIAGVMVVGILSGLTGTIMAFVSGFGLLTSSLVYIPSSFAGALVAILALVAWQHVLLPTAARVTVPLVARSDSQPASTGHLLSRN